MANVGGGSLNDLIEVGGDLTLGGTLNVETAVGGSFDPGIYRVINYGGTLTDNGLAIGTLPSPDFYVQTSVDRSEEHTSELQSLMRISYAVFCLKKNNMTIHRTQPHITRH